MINNLQKNKTVAAISLFCAIILLSAGCEKFGKKPDPPPPPPQQQAVKPQQQAQAKPVQLQSSSIKLSPAPVNQYDFSTKKDPFKPFVVVKVDSPSEKTSGKKPLKVALPIHNYDISQFRLVGIVTDTKGNKAMVMDPAGKAYVIKAGMTIGKSEAKISKIATTGVEVVEEFRDENGKSRKETIKIPLLRKP